MRATQKIKKVAVPRISFRVIRKGASDIVPIMKTEHAVKIARQLIPDDGREHFGVILCNTSNRVLGYVVVGIGGVSAVLASVREIIGAALRMPGCASFLCIHNHPSGDVEPSKHDKHVTKEVAMAARLFELRFHDHVIVGDGTKAFYSFDEHKGIKR